MNSVKRLFFQNLKMGKLLLEMWESDLILVSFIFILIQNNYTLDLILYYTHIESYIPFRVCGWDLSNLFNIQQERTEGSMLKDQRNDTSSNELHARQTMCRRSTQEKKRKRNYESPWRIPALTQYKLETELYLQKIQLRHTKLSTESSKSFCKTVYQKSVCPRQLQRSGCPMYIPPEERIPGQTFWGQKD